MCVKILINTHLKCIVYIYRNRQKEILMKQYLYVLISTQNTFLSEIHNESSILLLNLPPSYNAN